MAEATPAAEELAKEKGVDLDSVQGSGKDGRVLLEDVEGAVEAKEAEESADEAKDEAAQESLETEDPADDAEVVGEVAGDPLVVSQPSPESSVEAFKAHPHVPVVDQSPQELKDFQEESLASVEGTPEAAAAEAEEDDSEADDDADDGLPKAGEEGGPGSTDWILNRGTREKGFYVIPAQVNPNSEAARKADEEAASEQAKAAEKQDKAEEKDAEQKAQVDTSGPEATHGESLKEAAPAVAEVAGKPESERDDS